jgi:sulfur-carrier protein
MATVVIPALLRSFTKGQERVVVQGHNVGQIVENLEREFPGLGKQLVQDGDLKPSIAVSIDGEIAVGGLLEPVGRESEIYILPALGGG